MTDPWWKSAVVYQIWPRGFAGDLNGVRAHLDHLEALGVDAIWLCPVYPSPQFDAGYDVSDYQDIDPAFGTLADFDALAADLHARGMRLLMDVVLNHTSHEHPWFIQSRASRDSPKRDWYFWRARPNDWESVFSGPAWEYDETTGEHYLHLFAPQQPDLNWDNPEVRRAMYAAMRWWLDRGVDGFRLDAVQFMSKPPGLPDGDAYELVSRGPHLHDYLRELRREVGPDVLIVGECGVTVDQARLMTDPARGELDMLFQFEHVQIDYGESKWDPQPFRATALKDALGRWQRGLAGTGWNSLYLNNHDNPRVASRWGDGSPECAKCFATLLHLHHGTPFVYQGEELGLPNAPVSTPEDVESLRHYERSPDKRRALEAIRRMGRETARSPIPWDEAERQRAQPDSVFHHYRELIALRHREPAVVHGDFVMLAPDHEQVYAFTRSLGDTTLLVACNVSPEPARAHLLGTSHDFAPWEARIQRLSR